MSLKILFRIRYFACKPFHGLFVPPNKVRLNLSGTEVTPSTPTHIDKIENFEMDLSAVKEFSQPFDQLPIGLKTPTANIRSQSHTPASAELKVKQNDLMSLKEQISAVRSHLNNQPSNQEAVSNVVSKLTSMLDSYEKVAGEYESLLKQSIMAKKAGKLDGSINRLEVEVSDLSREKTHLFSEIERLRSELHSEIQSKEQFKHRLESQEALFNQLHQRLQTEERSRLALEEENQRLRFENTKTKTELDIEHAMEEEQRRRSAEHDAQIREMRVRFEAELHQKKLQVADLQNEVALLKQTEKILEEELKNRSSRLAAQDESELQRENRQLVEQVSQYRHQAEEYRKKYEEVIASKARAEDSFRAELEAFKQLRDQIAPRSDAHHAIELNEKLSKYRSENQELSRCLDSANNEIDRLTALSNELELRLHEKEKRISGLSERIQELEKRVLEDSIAQRNSPNLEHEVKLLNDQLSEARIRLNTPNDQVHALKRKVTLIEREKELLEEQLRNARVTVYSQGELQTFSGFIQSLKRHIESEILGLEPMKMTLSDVIRAKEIVDILIRVTEDVRLKVLSHLGQVEDVIKQRHPSAKPSIAPEATAPETVKIDRVNRFGLNDSDLRKRLDFHGGNSTSSARCLPEPLGVVNTSLFSKTFDSETRTPTASASLATAAGLTGSFSDYLRPLPSQPPLSSQSSSKQPFKVHEPLRCNLCHDYGHDSLSCTDYLSGTESDDIVLNDLRNNLRNRRYYNVSSR